MTDMPIDYETLCDLPLEPVWVPSDEYEGYEQAAIAMHAIVHALIPAPEDEDDDVEPE